MQREPSDSSTASTSTLRKIGSRLRRIGSKQEKSPITPSGDKPSVQKFVQELEATETVTPKKTVTDQETLDDASYQQLLEIVCRLRNASLQFNGAESAFYSYWRYREQTLGLCKALVRKHNTIVNSLYEAKVESRQAREEDVPPMNSAWLTVMQDLIGYQHDLLEELRNSIKTSYYVYEPTAKLDQIHTLFSKTYQHKPRLSIKYDINLRTPNTSPDYWPKIKERLDNFHQLEADLEEIESLCTMAISGEGPPVAIHEYEIASNGDSILEFSNAIPGTHPVLRFRVSSYMLTEASPFFARMFSPSRPDTNSPLEFIESFPPPPQTQICRDGTEVKVYRMPQVELNKWDAMTTLLHAAHMHNDKIPREVKYDEFVSIAEVCLRYQCTSPLEMAVEYLWLPQWVYKASEEHPDGFILISFVFGLRRLFTRTSKSAILMISSDEELESIEVWPREVKEKIAAVRQAKLAQIYTQCASLLKEYIRLEPDAQKIDRGLNENLLSVPKCRKGLHQCDAANLGWLMLVLDELSILPALLDMVNNRRPLIRSYKSVSLLTSSLRKMPSAPQLHSGACDYAPAFRSAMDDIYNSIVGLTLKEINGKDGWALSKKRDLNTRHSEDPHRQVFELSAPVPLPLMNPNAIRNDAVNLRIMSYVDDLEDLHAAAMINKSFYSVYKKHELFLMRNLAKAGKRKRISEITDAMQQTIRETLAVQSMPSYDALPGSSWTESLLSPKSLDRNIPKVTPSMSLVSSMSEVPLSSIEVDAILWPDQVSTNRANVEALTALTGSGKSIDWDSNTKFLTADVVRVDKSLVIEDRKHLRTEQDRNLRMGPSSPVAQTS